MSEPIRYSLSPDDPRTELRHNLISALEAVAVQFTSPISIEGVDATDLFGMNQLLGGAIEIQTVTVLNRLRNIWDPDDKYAAYEFRRYSESFPDVRLIGPDPSEQPLIGIELKGWYLLSKEMAPSFRFQASADAMTEFDLLVCYPWSLTNVISGKPMLHHPYIEQAKWAADMRTYYWQHRSGRSSSRSNEIIHPDTHPYPVAGSSYVDKAVVDSNNFGRVARFGIMQAFKDESLDIPLAGISARYWVEFLKLFTEANSQEDVERGLDRMRTRIRRSPAFADRLSDLDIIMEHMGVIVEYSMH